MIGDESYLQKAQRSARNVERAEKWLKDIEDKKAQDWARNSTIYLLELSKDQQAQFAGGSINYWCQQSIMYSLLAILERTGRDEKTER